MEEHLTTSPPISQSHIFRMLFHPKTSPLDVSKHLVSTLKDTFASGPDEEGSFLAYAPRSIMASISALSKVLSSVFAAPLSRLASEADPISSVARKGSPEPKIDVCHRPLAPCRYGKPTSCIQTFAANVDIPAVPKEWLFSPKVSGCSGHPYLVFC